MWFRPGIVSFVGLSLTIFLAVSASLIALLINGLVGLINESFGNDAFYVIFTSIMILFFALLSLCGFQFFHHNYTQNRSQQQKERVNYWTNVFSDVILFNDKAPKEVTEGAAAQAILELSEGFDEATANKLADLYCEYGFLSKDLKVLHGKHSAETRSKVLERLSLVKHPAIIRSLEKELQRKEPELRILAFQALARLFSHSSFSPDQVKRDLLPFITDKRFGLGLVEEALVVLGVNAGAILYTLLYEGHDEALVRLALGVVGRSKQQLWAHWCAAYIRHDNKELRAAAIKALAGLQFVPLYAYDSLEACLKDEVWFVRAQSATSSIYLLDDIEEQLIDCLADQNWWVRFNAAKALKERGYQGLRYLTWASEHHSDRYGRDMAKQVLALPSS